VGLVAQQCTRDRWHSSVLLQDWWHSLVGLVAQQCSIAGLVAKSSGTGSTAVFYCRSAGVV
jgi:hypothetical protein